jgi:dihydrofolate reductase
VHLEVNMRRVRYGVAMSLDGFIAGPNGEADWIVMDPDVDFATMFSQYDTLLMGRRTWEVAGAGGGAGADGLSVVVVSRTLRQQDHPAITIISDDLASRVRAMREAPGKDIWLWGGGELCRSLMELGLVDTVEVGIMPVLLGQGTPLVQPLAAWAPLRLTGHRIYSKSGGVGLEYEVVKRR